MRTYLIHFLVVAASLLLPAAFFAWWAEPVQGDLTRIGHWSEHEFGPNAAQPTIHIKATGPALVAPDISILGDSFSAPNLWQSVLADTSAYSVKSFNLDQNCIAAWVDAMTAQTSNKIIIIETVERSFVVNFRDLSRCSSTKLIPMIASAGTTQHGRPFWPPTLSWSYLLPTALNTLKLNASPGKTLGNAPVVNTVIATDCAPFSSRRNDRLLYFRQDDSKGQWQNSEVQAAVNNVLHIQREVERRGKHFVLVVAPDKSSVYRPCILPADGTTANPDIYAALIAAGVNAPDMLRVFRDKFPTAIDLYQPNDTHWSAAGFILAGKTVGRYVNEQTRSR